MSDKETGENKREWADSAVKRSKVVREGLGSADENFRKGYDSVKWDIVKESKKGPVHGHFC